MHFKITYINKGKRKTIIISAPSTIEAIKKFRNKKLGALIEIEKFEKPSLLERIKDFLINIEKIDLEEYLAILERCYVMLDAGIGIDKVLKDVTKSIKNPKLKKIFKSIEYNTNSGHSLTDSFKKFEKDLGTLSIAMIQLGEETGDIAKAIKDLSLILGEIIDNKKRLKKAIRYPLFTIFAMIVAFVIIIIFVVHPFKKIFSELHAELPLPTQLLLGLESALRNYGLLILISIVSIIVLIIFLYNHNQNIRLLIDKIILKLYLIGKITKLSMLSRFVYVLQKLINSGIPILNAVDIALKIIDNLYIKNQLLKIKDSITKGGTITKGFEDSKMYEEMIIQMIAAGEESGTIVQMLQKISNYYREKYRDIIDNISALIEPILLAVIAVFVLIMALGIFLPMWNMMQAAK